MYLLKSEKKQKKYILFCIKYCSYTNFVELYKLMFQYFTIDSISTTKKFNGLTRHRGLNNHLCLACKTWLPYTRPMPYISWLRILPREYGKQIGLNTLYVPYYPTLE